MKRKILGFVIFLVAGLPGGSGNTQAQHLSEATSQTKEIAVTIDDLPLNGSHIELKRLQTMTDKILSGIKHYKIPTVGFVNESLLYTPNETDARIALLKAWFDSGVELGNHTFSHMGFKDNSLANYQDDFIRGDAFIKILMKQRGQAVRYFRHPFLQMGNTPEIEKSFEKFIAERGYQIAPVTIDTMDWMFLAAYGKAKNQGDSEMVKRVSEEYLKFVDLKFAFCEQLTGELFGYPIKHILLLHANELNADNFDGLVKIIKNRGYQFITLEAALKDPVYRFPDTYISTSDWLAQWAFNKGKKFAPSPSPLEFIQKAFSDAQK
ncbi:MAG: polysaccharide deacetylase family protein [Acidobacteriota bacterium]